MTKEAKKIQIITKGLLQVTLLLLFHHQATPKQPEPPNHPHPQTTQKGLKSVQFTPILLSEIITHGAITPKDNIFLDKNFQNLGLGQITPNGQRQHFALGSYLKKHYPYIFFSTETDPIYNAKVYSANNQRNLISAETHLLGLYPLGKGPTLSSNNGHLLVPPFKDASIPEPHSNFALPPGYSPYLSSVSNSSSDRMFLDDIATSCPNVNLTAQAHRAAKLFSSEFEQELQDLQKRLITNGYDPGKLFNATSFSLWDYATLYLAFKSNLGYYGAEYVPQDGKIFSALRYVYGFLLTATLQGRYQTIYSTLISQQIVDSFHQKLIFGGAGGLAGEKSEMNYMLFSADPETITSFLLGLNVTSKACIIRNFKNFYNSTNSSLTDSGPRNENLNCVLEPRYASSLVIELNSADTITKSSGNAKTENPQKSKKTAKNGESWSPDTLKLSNTYTRILYNGLPLTFCDQKYTIDEKGHYCNTTQFLKKFTQIYIEPNFERICTGLEIEYKTVGYSITILILLSALIYLCVYVVNYSRKPIKIDGISRFVDVFSDLSKKQKLGSFLKRNARKKNKVLPGLGEEVIEEEEYENEESLLERLTEGFEDGMLRKSLFSDEDDFGDDVGEGLDEFGGGHARASGLGGRDGAFGGGGEEVEVRDRNLLDGDFGEGERVEVNASPRKKSF